MKIALLNENSQSSKNSLIYECLTKEGKKKGHIVYNLGMTGKENEHNLTYVQLGLMAALLINTKSVDFIVTGCGTGVGAMLALNSFPNVLCGLANDATDAYLFGQINDGNAISIAYAKGFGWGSEINLENIFYKLFEEQFGLGYPKERREIEQKNKKILDEVKKVTTKDMLTIIKEINQDFLKDTLSHETFTNYLLENSKDEDINNYIKSIL